MKGARLVIALAKLIERDLNDPRKLRYLASHIPAHLESIAEHVKELEIEIGELKKENNLLLAEFDKQEVFPFIRIAESEAINDASEGQPESIFRVVGED